MLVDEEFMNKVRNNSKENVATIFGTFFNNILLNIFQNNESFYNKINMNEELKEQLKK